MSLSTWHQVLAWGALLTLLVLLFWYLGNALTPFVAGAALAYFLDPIADRLESRGLSRVWATVTITFAALLAILVAALIVVPFLADQTHNMIEQGPAFLAAAEAKIAEWFPEWVSADSPMWNGLTQLQNTLQARSGELLGSILSSSFAVVNFLLIIILAPVVAFYLLMDWDHMVAKVDSWLPRDHAPTIRRLAREIDVVLSGFVRGQITVCAILGVGYAIGLTLVGLQFGLVIGLFAGLISFIPYIGSTFGGIASLLMALFQFWGQPWRIVLVVAVFVVGQMIEGNFLTPRLVGRSVGLHPVWLMFALAAFGALFGFAGLLVAVPVAASIGVLGRFALEKYMDGPLYRGSSRKKGR